MSILWFCFRDGNILFMVYGYYVCKTAWLAIHSITQRQFQSLLNDLKDGKVAISSPIQKKRKTRTFISKASMESAFKKMGDKMPDSISIHLPCYLNYKILYSYMVADLEAVGDDPVSYSQFCTMMEKDFKEVSIPKACTILIYQAVVRLIIRPLCLLNQLLICICAPCSVEDNINKWVIDSF